MIKVVVSGACGRMGSACIMLINKEKDMKLTGAVEIRDNKNIGRDIGEVLHIGKTGVLLTDSLENISDYDVVIEFTNPKATLEHVKTASRHKKSMVVGTTGFNNKEREEFFKIGKNIPCVFAPNMSVGVNVLYKLIRVAAKVLSNYDIEVIELHHKKKKDAPSGTAKRIVQSINLEVKKDIKTHSIRAGDIVGDHIIVFSGNGERLEIKHQAHTRDVFVYGAIKAVRFLAKGVDAGFYTMENVLGL